MGSQSQPDLKLFYSPGACSFVPHVALLESGLDFTLVLAKIGHLSDEFLAINPKRRVPVITMGDEIITEMAAILTAIASLASERHLLGKSTLETIRVYEWLNYLSTTAHGQAMASILRTERFTNDISVYPAIKKKGMEVLLEVCTLVDEKLSSPQRHFAVGDSYTVAEGFLVVLFLWASKLKVDMSEYPHFSEYVHRLFERKSIAEARKIHLLRFDDFA